MTKKIAKIKKIIVAETPKPEVPTAVETTIGALLSLQASTGWAIIMKILNDNITYLEKAILEKIDPTTGESLTDVEVEILRTKRNLNIEVRDTPANYSKSIKDAGEIPQDFDPYFHTNDEVKQYEKNK